MIDKFAIFPQVVCERFRVRKAVFGSIPPIFEEGYEIHVNLCSLLIHFDSFVTCY